MTTRHNAWNGTLIATLLLLSTGSAMAQSWGGFSFNAGGQKIRIGAPSRTGSSRSSGRFNLPTVVSGGNSRQSNGLQQVLRTAASEVASQSMRQLAPGVQRSLQQGQPRHEDMRFRPGKGRSGIRLNLGGFRIEHAQALAHAVVAGGGCKVKSPFCGSRPACPPRPCPTHPIGPVTYTPEQHFELARQAFRIRNYDRAGYHVDQAIAQLPEEPELFQFRSLILFAKGEYPLAADAAYTALSAGPGWNWETLYKFYGEADVYTRHLRNLEAATRANPDSAAHHFLLAYHYLMLNEVEAGRKRLQRVLDLQPGEPLTEALLDMLPASN
jgi:hypothetical protein